MEMGSRENRESMKIDSGEKRLNELGYKQELRREMVSIFFLSLSLTVFLSR